mmetsp:Transcript_49577/g.105504  ORF Transcript_49577/g.105504 Transcript_49577/m.105504 type:complete len:302 (-) Transcript_49577:122-1027(-)|eukprot:CAMPEP_0206477214 /NCGR_PEP_ID=MMETSP0324_2-20121206/35217_1 /ASSEMBLY_ACC=CAM_ASM_000836 /TAXON_ID=2866 /ORGANISM="Crypthecodinium cohnii, Strain Seligo" /LENGTH=301 /DNA_ID=CAMNT_0053953071 /DNA_START=46 /DNA_END=951 /DNA_ORIENTATION=-
MGYQGSAAEYGSFDATIRKAPASPKRPLNVFAVMVCLCVPVTIFFIVCYSLSKLKTTSAALANISVALAGVVAFGSAVHAGYTLWKRAYGLSTRDPFWYIFLGFTSVVAWCSGHWLGDHNWTGNVTPYFALQALDSHFDVDPSVEAGIEHIDAGRITFKAGSKLNLTQSMGFKSRDQYCVTPIVRNTAPQSYDYWAIGLNCCPGIPADFRCGDYASPNARAGLRLVEEDQRALYALAVQQAEATYGIQATQPLFFYWLEDPTAELESYKEEARRTVRLGSLSFGALQLFMVFFAMFIHSKL